MKLLLTVLILGVAIALAYANGKGEEKYANLLFIMLLAFVALFAVFGFIADLGTSYPNGLYIIE